METSLTITETTIGHIRPWLAAVYRKADNTAGATSLDEVLRGARAYVVTLEGLEVTGYALRVAGPVCWIVAAAGSAQGVDLTHSLLPTIERQAQALGCTQLALATKRAGLAKKITAHGFRATSTTWRKAI